MIKWKVKFEQRLFSELNNYLFENSPNENGCFLLGTTKENVLFVTDIIYPESNEWLNLGEDLCEPSPRYIIHASLLAQNSNSTLIFVHTHPQDHHPSSFSWIDEISNERMFKNLSEVISEPLGSFVFSRNGIHGVMYENNQLEAIDKYLVYGENLEIIMDSESHQYQLDSEEFSRQLLFMDSSAKVLSNLKIAIVGLGGIGSPLAVQLAKMGVKNLSLFDHDKVEVHNLPRIYGANHSSIGKFKVNVVKDHLSDFCDASIQVFSEKINVNTNLSDFDIVFGCVDNHSTRHLLNEKSLDFCIPYIDSACSIPLDQKRQVNGAVISVNTVFHNTPCLWCNKTLNPNALLEEGLSEEEFKKRVDDGYVHGVTSAPSVITLTTSVSSFAINRMLNLIGILSEIFPNKMIFDFNSSLYFEPNTMQNQKCRCANSKVFKSRVSSSWGKQISPSVLNS